MTEEVQFELDSAKEAMQKSLERLDQELTKIRAGKSNPSMLSSVKVDYYGALTPLAQVANVSTPDAKTLTVQPWEKGMLGITHEGVSHNSDGSREKHLEVWKRNYINYEYPKHKLNYVLELEYLLDKDDETYYNLTKFLNVKPIDNWKQHIEKYKKSIKI